MLALFPEINACAKTGDVEKLAVMVRAYFAPESVSIPSIDAYKLAANFGIPVRTDFLDYFAALAVGDTRGDIKVSVVISRSSGREQQTFTLCHLLGHFFFHVQPALISGDWKRSGFKETTCPLLRYTQTDGLSGMSAQEYAVEDLADRFAAALLMPAHVFHLVMDQYKDIHRVAQIFGVTSETAMRRQDEISGKKFHMPAMRSGAVTESTKSISSDRSIKKQGHNSNLDSDLGQLMPDLRPNVQTHSRVVATHSYSDAALGEPQNDSNQVSVSKLRGMDRIRELARKMDKFGDKSK